MNVDPVRVFLDDEREPPDGWRFVRWPGEAIELLETGRVVELSLDHDLGDDARGTGYDVVLSSRACRRGAGLRATRDAGALREQCGARQMEAGSVSIERLARRGRGDRRVRPVPMDADRSARGASPWCESG